MRYLRPFSYEDPSTAAVLYEAYDEWLDDGIIVCFSDIHCETITDQNYFEQLLR